MKSRVKVGSCPPLVVGRGECKNWEWYPYGYQKPNKQVIIRTYQKAKKIKFSDEENLLAKTNSQIGCLKNYNCKKLIIGYEKTLSDDAKKILSFDINECKFKRKKD